MHLDLAQPDVAAARRERLAGALGGQRALLFAGQARPRNYPDAPYPFRASSHFLYFVGLGIEHAVLLVDGAESTLFVTPPEPADELWHGPVPDLEAIAAAVGCAVRPLVELTSHVEGAATIAAVDVRTRLEQEQLLGRGLVDPTSEALEDTDATLIDAVIACRSIHDEAAIAGLRNAADGTAAAHLAGMAATRAGLTEFAVRAAMESAAMARSMGTAYGSIVTVHGEVLHNDSYHHTLQDGDLLLADVGAESPRGWAGDVTRTWPVSGRFSATQRTAYEIVLRAQAAAIEEVKPGARYRDVHLAACRALTAGLVDIGVLKGDVHTLVADGVHALFFPHGVGHLIGLDVHDMEDLGDRAGYASGRSRSAQFGLAYLRCDRDLAPGMAVTIEPGFYQVPAILADEKLSALAGDRLDRAELAKFGDVRGIRIEDDVLVTASGRDVLTNRIPKQVADVEACVSP